ncbi:hypothetical protein QJS04_geneDACA015063 [Acorus gramineus]|uniref:Uncharacterized protein n=1 Tax=Acorus gramineus TaxID=55184 RepID=A0AAV9BWQ5_ACOGR|nr:hypothetical protein QJS04_geneDACA015063 [Acorus gramineus]
MQHSPSVRNSRPDQAFFEGGGGTRSPDQGKYGELDGQDDASEFLPLKRVKNGGR